MNDPTWSENVAPNRGNASCKLMVHGFVSPAGSEAGPLEVWRGMSIRSEGGLEVGKVAAVVVEHGDQKARYLLLSRLPESSGYWLVGVDLILGSIENALQLAIPDIEALPRWHSP